MDRPRPAALLITMLAIAATAVLVGSAYADDTTPRGFYLDPGGGVNWLDQGDTWHQPTDTGWRLDLVAGYRFDRHWGVELHTGYLENTMAAADQQYGSVTIHWPERTLHQVPCVIDLVGYIPTRSPLEPYLGAGVGVIRRWYASDSGGTDGAFEVLVGTRYRLSAGLDLNVGYRLLVVMVSSLLRDETESNGSVTVGLTIRP